MSKLPPSVSKPESSPTIREKSHQILVDLVLLEILWDTMVSWTIRASVCELKTVERSAIESVSPKDDFFSHAIEHVGI